MCVYLCVCACELFYMNKRKKNINYIFMFTKLIPGLCLVLQLNWNSMNIFFPIFRIKQVCICTCCVCILTHCLAPCWCLLWWDPAPVLLAIEYEMPSGDKFLVTLVLLFFFASDTLYFTEIFWSYYSGNTSTENTIIYSMNSGRVLIVTAGYTIWQ